MIPPENPDPSREIVGLTVSIPSPEKEYKGNREIPFLGHIWILRNMLVPSSRESCQNGPGRMVTCSNTNPYMLHATGIFTYMKTIKFYAKCRQIFHIWSIWVRHWVSMKPLEWVERLVFLHLYSDCFFLKPAWLFRYTKLLGILVFG